MIGSLRGTLLDRGAAEVTIEVGGVGYRVSVSPTTVVALGDVGEEVFCWVHHHQREDAVTLYGFGTRDERTCFEALLGAHGVGPALALAILSVHSPIALARILAEDDLGALCLVPGVGKKTAARLLLDLKSRLSIPDLGDAPTTSSGGSSGSVVSSVRADVRDALAGLGYTDAEVREVMADLPDDGDAGALLRDALQRLATARR
ncbi:MAG: Holliday junction branch migration protein RuvA [Acidimicrobiales bacterium]